MLKTTAIATAIAALLASPAIAAAKPKPWMWTPAQAGAALKALGEINARAPDGTITDVDVLAAKCAPKGKAVQKRYTQFRCVMSLREGQDSYSTVFWVKVRAVGKGEPCWSLRSLSSVNPLCSNIKGVRAGDADDGERALRLAMATDGRPYQGPNACASFGVGFFECWFGGSGPDDPMSGLATVVLVKGAPVVKITRPATG